MKSLIFLTAIALFSSTSSSVEAKGLQVSLTRNINYQYSHSNEKLSIVRKFSRHLHPYVQEKAVIGINNGVQVSKLSGERHFKLASDELSKTSPGYDGGVNVSAYIVDTEWLGEITIGTPPQKVLMNFDTGSSDTWVITPTTDGETASNHSTYDPTKSSTFVKKTDTWNITYLDNSTSYGYIATDLVQIGPIKIKDQAIEIADHASSFNSNNLSGIVGLSFDNNEAASVRIRTPLDNMVYQKLIHKPEFGVQLIKSTPRNTGGLGGGKYVFGGHDTSVIRGHITRKPVETFGDYGKIYWATTIDDVKVNNQSSKKDGKPSSALSIFDTGTTLIYVDDDTANGIHSHINGSQYVKDSGVWVVPCNITGPPVFLTISGRDFGIPIEDLASVGAADDKGELCISGIQGGQVAVPKDNQTSGQPLYYLIGDIFFKNNYVIFNQGGIDATFNSTIGFARRKDVVVPKI